MPSPLGPRPPRRRSWRWPHPPPGRRPDDAGPSARRPGESSATSSLSATRRKVRRPFCRLSTATSRSPAPRVRSGPASAAHRGAEGAAQVPVGDPGLGHPLGDGLGLAAEDGEAVLVGDGPLVGDVVQLVGPAVGAQLGHQDLDLEGLHLVGEDVAQELGVEVGQRPGVDVLAAEGEPLGVGVADPGHPELVVLVVLAHPGEGDAVVDLADLVERARGVLGHDEHAVGRRRWPPASVPGRCPSGRTRPGPSSPARGRRRRAWSSEPPPRPPPAACARSRAAKRSATSASATACVARPR